MLFFPSIPIWVFFLSSVYQHLVRPHLLTSQNVVDDDVDVSDVNLVVTIDIANDGPAVTIGAGYTGVTAAAATIDDDVDHVVDIGNVDLAVSVHIPKHIKDGISID